MKYGLCVGGRSAGGSMPSGKMVGHEVRESGKRPSSTTTRRVGM
jgi:hypothetical protein